MNPFSNTKLERLAVVAIENEAMKFDLIPNIPVGDKGISFDGDIDVMKDDSEKKESLMGKVPVQVKGTFVDNFTEGNRTFSLEIAHLINFYNRNGAILFVVEVNNKMQTKIFFKHLLPLELRVLIKKYEKQISRSIKLRPLNETNLYRVCTLFLEESKKQAPILLESNPFNYKDFTDFHLSSLTFNPMNEKTSNIYEHDFIVYGMVKGLSVPIGITRLTSEIIELKETIIFDKKEIEVDLKITKNNEQISLLLDKSIELILKETREFSFKINKFISIKTQLKLLPILQAMLSGKKVYFIEQGYIFEEGKPDDKKWIKSIEDLYQKFLKLKKAFSMLNVMEDVEFTEEDEYFVQSIDSFIQVVLENNLSGVKLKEPNATCFVGFKLGGIKFTFYHNPTSDTPLINSFSKELLERDTRLEIDGVFYPYSPYFKLNEESLAFSQNIDFMVLKTSYDQFDPFANEQLFNATNHFCLLCVGAYDLSEKKELLQLASYIYSKYKTGLSQTSNIILRINQLQINLRLNGTLKKEEIDELIKIKLSSQDNEQVQFCASVLLRSKIEADWFFSNFESEIQSYYTRYPIFRLYEQM